MRYHVKGGIWKNTEDEVLKAAVMKYGLNQWSRISSLLVRKSAKQCKERWYEWLDPSIKKIEWTKDEEEKLLNLAKMFPCQWRTIAPIVGRTAYQCMEHYEKLLDRAQGREADENDPRKLRPGEIDPNPETKPARPDPIDMDEDQKEMLNEARARLANTKGKKAKRKAREKQLEEARRLAGLQKKRELKSAGIDVVLRLPRKKKKEMNYNIDVPFLRQVPEGNWENKPEETPAANKFKGAISLQFLENRNRDEEEEKFRKIDQKRMKNLKTKNLPEAIEKINKMNDPTNIFQRNKLVLPEPQVTDRDLEGISKLTSNGVSIQDSTIAESNATKVLMGEYSQREINPMTALRTPKVEDNIMREAKLAISLRENSTPLIGGENSANDLQNYLEYKKTEMRKDEFKAPFAKTPLMLNQTNNIYNSKNSELRNKSAINNSIPSTFGRTPLRDEMKLNLEEDLNSWDASSVDNKDNFSVGSNISKIPNISQLLSKLPKPQNKYEIDIISETTLDSMRKEEEEDEVKMEIEDEEDRKKREQMEKEEEQKKKFLNETQVIQRGLLRPMEINNTYQSYLENKLFSVYDEDEVEDLQYRKTAEELIKQEMNKIVECDAINHPQKGIKIKAVREEVMALDDVTLEDKNIAAEYLNMEIEEIKTLADYNYENFCAMKEEVNANIFYIPDVQRYCHIEDIEVQQKFDSYNEIYDIKKNCVLKEESIAKKLEEKSNILMGGYFKRMENLKKKYSEIANEINDYKLKIKIYQELKDQEELSILKRQKDLEDKIEMLKDKEKDLQRKYKNLTELVDELEKV